MKKNAIWRYVLFFYLILSGYVCSQDNYFGKPVGLIVNNNKTFWKKIYSEIDSSRTVVFNKTSLKTYCICKNEMVQSKIDSLQKTGVGINVIKVKQGRKEFIQDAFIRAQKYSFVDDSLIAHGLHRDLKWLPVLESGYLDTIVSESGAKGIWQFMDYTGKNFGLTSLNIADPKMSTSAFVQYFTKLYREFNDYSLAITAYHHGEFGVRNKLKKRNSKELSSILNDLGFESRNYYAKYLSILEIQKEQK